MVKTTGWEMIEFACWGCGKLLKAPDDAGGKKCKCSKCERENTIPVTEKVLPSESIPQPTVEPQQDMPQEIEPPSPQPTQRTKDELILERRERDGTEGRILNTVFFIIVSVVMVLAVGNMLMHMTRDVTVPQYDNEAMQRVNGYPRIFNSIKAQEQTVGVQGSGILALISLGVLFLLKMSIQKPNDSRPANAIGHRVEPSSVR